MAVDVRTPAVQPNYHNILEYCNFSLLCDHEVTFTPPCKADVVLLTLGRPPEFDVTISTLQQRCDYNIHALSGNMMICIYIYIYIYMYIIRISSHCLVYMTDSKT